MAIDTRAKIHTTLVDDAGVRAAFETFCMIDSTKTIANVMSDILLWGTTVAAISDAGWYRCELGIQLLPTASLTGVAGTDSDVSSAGVWDMSNASDPWVYGYAIPSISDANLTNGRITRNAAVTALNALLVTTLPQNTQFTNRSWVRLNAVVRTFSATRKHRRSLHQKTVDTY